MPSPFSAQERVGIFEILGLPIHGHTVNLIALVLYPFSNVSEWSGGTNSKGDLVQLIADIDAILAMISAEQAIVVRTYLATWDDIKASELVITNAANSSAGTIVHHGEKRILLRGLVANILGISVPAGGYLHEIEAVYGKSLKEFRKGGTGTGGLGDR